MRLTELREHVAATLEQIDSSWTVHPAPVDAISPPAFVLVWSGDPVWLEDSTVCLDVVQMDVIVVVPRLEVGDENYRLLEQMIDAARAALSSARIPVVSVRPPGPFEIAQITYLAARLVVRELVDKPPTVYAEQHSTPAVAGYRPRSRSS